MIKIYSLGLANTNDPRPALLDLGLTQTVIEELGSLHQVSLYRNSCSISQTQRTQRRRKMQSGAVEMAMVDV